MNNYDEADQIGKLIDGAKNIVIVQADNPDGDSLASALALEQILHELGKEPYLYCGVDIPEYLKHLQGWDRVNKDIPSQLDLSIIVDTSSLVLLEKLEHSRYRQWVVAKPVIVLDHHALVKADIPYAKIIINDAAAVATGEVIYKLAHQLSWSLNLLAKSNIVSSILSDSMGLTSEGTTAQTYRIMANLIEGGVDRPALEEARRAFQKMPESIFHYKAQLIERTELLADGRVAYVSIPHDEIMEYSPLYNPAPLIQTDMLQIEGVLVGVVLKLYQDGKITGSIRSNVGASIAGELAEQFGGGGHAYAAGFKITDGKKLSELKISLIKKATELLNSLKGSGNAAL